MDREQELAELIRAQRKDDVPFTRPEPGVVVMYIEQNPALLAELAPGETAPSFDRFLSKGTAGCTIHGFQALYTSPGYNGWTKCNICARERTKMRRDTDPDFRARRREIEAKSYKKRMANMTEEKKEKRRQQVREARARMKERKANAQS